MGANHAGQSHKQASFARQFVRHADDAGQNPGHLDNGNFVFTAKSVFARQTNNEIQRFVGHLRKRVGWVQADWGEQRLHLALEIRFDPVLLDLIAFVVRQNMNATFGKSWQQGLVVQLILLIHQGVGTLADSGMAVQAVGPRMFTLARSAQVQLGAHFEKLVQVGRHNAQIAQALEQRHIGAPRPVQNAQVKAQDAFVAVEQRQMVSAV